jgi:hypothetical protein
MSIKVHIALRGWEERIPLCTEHYKFDQFAVLIGPSAMIRCEHCDRLAVVLATSPKEGTSSAAQAGGDK